MRATSLRTSFACAFAGLWSVLCRERNFRFQTMIALIVIAAASFCNLPAVEWAMLVLTIGVVLAAEVFNFVLEAMLDLISPELHPVVKAAKDASAGAVLLLAMAAVAVGLLILGPPLFARLLG